MELKCQDRIRQEVLSLETQVALIAVASFMRITTTCTSSMESPRLGSRLNLEPRIRQEWPPNNSETRTCSIGGIAGLQELDQTTLLLETTPRLLLGPPTLISRVS